MFCRAVVSTIEIDVPVFWDINNYTVHVRDRGHVTSARCFALETPLTNRSCLESPVDASFQVLGQVRELPLWLL